MKKKTNKKKTTTITGLQVPGLGWAFDESGRVKHVCEHSSGKTPQ